MSNPVFSDTSDYIPPNLTEPFSQVLCVSDSDETVSENGNSSGSSVQSDRDNQDVVDLTRLSNSKDEFSSTRSDSDTSENKPCSLIEIPDSTDSSLNFNCSTINSNPSRLSTCARARLNDFFDNIPNSASESSTPKPEQFVKSQSFEVRQNSCEDSKESAIDKTQSSHEASSESNQCESEENYPDVKKLNVNISAKIKIKVHVSEVCDESTAESEQENEQPTKSSSIAQSCNQETQRFDRFIDGEMQNILTEIYGPSWKTRQMLSRCILTPRPATNDDDPKDKAALKQTDNRKVSFLESLDEATPLALCSKEALQYRTHYNSKKDELMHHLLDLYNRKIFGNKLDVPCIWNKKLTCTAGRCVNTKRQGERFSAIQLSDKVLTSAGRLRCTLVHEMCHAAAWLFSADNGHGKKWKEWTKRARQVFPELPPITVCHRYEIEYKYTYQCVLCKARYDAHTRSLKTERIRCAICYGGIEVFLNKKTKDGQIIATPAKKAKGFAAFVKESYKQVREQESDHKLTMQVLGEKFSALSTEERSKYS